MKRLDSLDFLRGWASVFVVISHLLGVFWVEQSALEHLMGYSSIGVISLHYAEWIIDKRLYFGQFGVAIFFLISGYVITLSLEKYHGFGFLLNRIIRIYPVYIVGFCMTILGLYLVDFQHDGIPYTITELFMHILILPRQWFDYPRIDGISWTLEIELYFYILMFIIFQFKAKIRYLIVNLLLVSILASVLLLSLDWSIARQILLIAYMLLGYYFFNLKSNNISIWKIIVFLSIVLGTMFIFYSTNKPFNVHLYDWYLPYLVAPLIFFIMVNKIKDYKIDKVSKFLSKISYPLYVVHPIFGYALLVYFLKAGYSSWVALGIVMIIVILLAYIIHLWIEKVALKYAKIFNRKKTD